MSDTVNVSTFDSIANFSPSATSSWENFSVDFSSYTGTGQYIAFRCNGYGATNAMFVDDLVLMTTPSCNIPTGLTRLAYTTNSMTFDWDSIDDANCLGWLIDYKLYEDENWQSEFAATHPHTLSNLNPNNVYNIRLRAICTSGDTTFHSNVLNYGMPCDPITTFPWNEGFENVWWVGDGLGTSTDSRPWCWVNINGGTQANGVWRKTTSSSYVRTGTGALQMYSGSTSAGDCNDWFITPVMTLTGSERLQFWAKGYSTYTDELNIQIFDVTTNGAMTSVADTSLFTVVMPNVIVPASDWTPYEVSLTQFIGDYRIAFVRNTTGGYYLNIDDISVSPMPQCARPSAVSFSNITANSADVDWIPANTTDFAWWVYYREVGTTAWDSIYAITYPVNITNLTGDTEYEVEIRTDCGYQLSSPSFTMTFRTACAPISTLPWIENFDTYGPAGSFPSCWSRPIIYSTYPKTSTTASRVHSGTSSLEIHSALTPPTYAITPAIGQDINTLRVKFWAMAESITSSGTLEVGVMSDPNDVSTFESVDIIQPLNVAYNQYEVYFANTTLSGLNRYIAFRQNTVSAAYYYWIDDVEIDYIPACAKPLYLNVSNTTATSTDISWTPGNQNSNSWWLYWKNKTTNVLDSAYVSGMTTHNIINLTPNTEYEYYLITDCLTELSESSSIGSFTTPCSPEVTLPWIEGFETYGSSGAFPPCWSRPIMYSTYPKTSTTASRVHGGTSSLEIHSALTPPTYAVTPAFAHNIDSLRVKFWAMAESITSSGTLEVGIMSDPADVSTFESVEIIQPLNTAYNQYEVYFTNTTLKGMDRYIAFRQNTVSAIYYYWIDDVEVDFIPSCPKPINQVANNITTNSAEISWTSTSQATTSWWLYWKETTASNFDSVLVTNDTLYNLSNLNSGTTYEYYLISDCSTEISEPTNISTFFTSCASISSFPWIEGFESTWATASGISNDAVPTQCWININGGASTSYKWRKSTTSTVPSYVRTGSGSAQLYGANAAMGDYLITPIFTFTGNEQLNFWGKGYSTTTNYPEHLWVKAYNVTLNGDISSFADTTSFIDIGFINDTNRYTWNEYDFPLTSLVGDYRLVFARVNNVGYYYHIDDMVVDIIPACPRPTTASATNITATSADLSWTPGSPSDVAWKIYYRTTGSSSWDSVMATNTTHSLTGLLASTNYEVGITTDCGNGSFSNMRLVSFRTQCGAITALPWTDNFDSYGTGTSIFPACWTRLTTQTDRPYVNATNYSSPGSLYFYATSSAYNYASMPALDPSINISNLKATFKYRTTLAADELVIGVMSDPNIASTFVPVDTVSAASTTTWYDKTVLFSNYVGTGHYIAFHIQSSGTQRYAYIDDLEISYDITCAAPTNVVANNIATTSADISWTAGGSEIGWQIREGLSGTIVNLVNTQYQATGLTANTPYTFYVRSDCGSGAFSSWVAVNFTTDDMPTNPVVTTSQVTAYTHNTATFTGSYTEGSDVVTAIGFDYKLASASNWTNTPI
ncbi:MAG: choice-of-anchor J domain-containing protein, partial [Tissierellaceae bacterium]|nr:choice-of-anchor J domain-containing protein [Tissierellaceae bacterium]